MTHPEQLFKLIKERQRKHLVSVWPTDVHTLEAVVKAVVEGYVYATLIGQQGKIVDLCNERGLDTSLFEIVDVSAVSDALTKALQIINEGRGDILMKGNISTDKFIRAILDREQGLTDHDSVLSHVTVMKIPSYHKFLIVGDVAVIPSPDLKQKIAIAGYLIKTAHAIGIEKPKLSVVAATEQVLPGMPACTDGAILSKMAERGQLPDAFVDGPLSLDLSLNKDSVKIKAIESNVAGDADCLLFPNIESGNVFYKTTALCGESWHAAILKGARKPLVLSSRADSTRTKLNSILLAATLSKYNN